MLPVNEVFETIQGEAYWTGTPSVFVRLQGCDVGCPWCDTKHTWGLSPAEEVPTHTMIRKTHDGPSYAALGASQLASIVCGFKARHVVLTGGEPCLYDLTELTGLLLAQSRTVPIETSGAPPIHAALGTWVTVSPKIDMPGGFAVMDGIVAGADEVKMPVGKPHDVERLQELVDRAKPRGLIWLQPLSTSEKATALCVKAATENGWRLSMQTHKYLGLR